jgi:choline-glycine betaine transporter
LTEPEVLMSVRVKSYARIVAAGVVLLLAAVTAVIPDWFEAVFGVGPDGGDGSFEWAIVVVAVAAVILSAVVMRAEWRRLRAGISQ